MENVKETFLRTADTYFRKRLQNIVFVKWTTLLLWNVIFRICIRNYKLSSLFVYRSIKFLNQITMADWFLTNRPFPVLHLVLLFKISFVLFIKCNHLIRNAIRTHHFSLEAQCNDWERCESKKLSHSNGFPVFKLINGSLKD